MESKLAELRKGEVSTSDTQRSEAQRTQKAIRTLEYKLDRVSCETHYHKIPTVENTSLNIIMQKLC